MSYVDGFVVPVPRAKIDAYRDLSRKAGQIWRDHGALEYREWVADDVQPGELTSFPQSVMLQADEVVVFAYIRYHSRAHRDEINAKVMKDPRMAGMGDPAAMPFDSKRMIYGGFEPLVEA